jgi:hypothetical protein
MTAEITVTFPLNLPRDVLMAVRTDETTKTEDRDEMDRRIGWLLCAWDVMVNHRKFQPGKISSFAPGYEPRPL